MLTLTNHLLILLWSSVTRSCTNSFNLRAVSRETLIVIFRCENALKWILFSKSSWKNRKKNVMETFFFWSCVGLIWSQKWTHTQIEHFTKNSPNRHFWAFFIGERLKMIRTRFSLRFWQNRIYDFLILWTRLHMRRSRHPLTPILHASLSASYRRRYERV